MPMVSVLQIVCGIVLSFLYAGMVLLSMVVDAKVMLPEPVMAGGSNCVFLFAPNVCQRKMPLMD